MTSGSCQGHPQSDGQWSPSYVVMRLDSANMRHRGRIDERGIWQVHGRAWMIRAEEAERLWGSKN